MFILQQGESLVIPATVTGDKTAITNLVVKIKRSIRGEVPLESAATVATLTSEDYTSAEITGGYLFKLADTSALDIGIYYVNYEYNIGGLSFKGSPYKVVVRESVI